VFPRGHARVIEHSTMATSGLIDACRRPLPKYPPFWNTIDSRSRSKSCLHLWHGYTIPESLISVSGCAGSYSTLQVLRAWTCRNTYVLTQGSSISCSVRVRRVSTKCVMVAIRSKVTFSPESYVLHRRHLSGRTWRRYRLVLNPSRPPEI
jgi:hypothetical protein